MKFIIALTTHRHLGYILVPYLIDKTDRESFYTLVRAIRRDDLLQTDYPFSPEEKELITLTDAYSDESLTSRYTKDGAIQNFYKNMDPDFFTKKIIPYVEQKIIRCISIIQKYQIPLYLKAAQYINLYDEDLIEVTDDLTEAIFNFERTPDEIRYFLSITHHNEEIRFTGRKAIMLTNDPCRLVLNNKLYLFKDITWKNIQPFFQKQYISVPHSMENKYFNTFILNSVKKNQVIAQGFSIKESTPIPEPELSFENSFTGLPILSIKFRYGNKDFLVTQQSSNSVYLEKKDDEYIFYKFNRDFDFEKNTIATLEQLGLKLKESAFIPTDITSTDPAVIFYRLIRWLQENQQTLSDFNIRVSQDRLDRKYFTGTYDLKFQITDSGDWFDIYAVVTFGPFQFPFIRLKKHLLKGIREFELPNGEIAILPAEWFSRYCDLFPLAETEGDTFHIKKHHYALLRSALDRTDKKYQKEFEKLNAIENIPINEIPIGLKAHLRSYQFDGYNWMDHLRAFHFGGCLADDMGLGKTLQTLTLLLKLKKPSQFPPIPSFFCNQDGQLPLFSQQPETKDIQPASLIVVPTSLIHNWENEIRKFTPSLKSYRYIGIQRKKNTNLQAISQYYDIILTTYGTLRNDASTLAACPLYYVILDESQYIKNPSSKTYKAVLQLKPKYRLVITGTPIENSLMDLWSQINFLNPGLLGNLKYFKQEYILPIEKHNDEDQQNKLRKLIRPFILRRTKDEVARDLPPRTEQTIFCEMNSEQKELYEKEKSAVRNQILENVDQHGVNKSAIVILQGLTRLRQLALHPSLIKDDYTGESGKFNEILRNLSSLMAEKHKVLVFSSFVGHLRLLAQAIHEKGWAFSVLTGHTIDREKAIRDFQEKENTRIFLISLKAGGVGLNLTSADYVFLTDPWWNPATENQAINRAHRIGQDKKVFVYRFIARHSIEQKIQSLQEKKSQLAEQFINSNNPLKTITRNEIIDLFT